MTERLTNTQTIASALETGGIPPSSLPANAQCVLLRYPVCVRRKAQFLARAALMRSDLAGWYNSPVHPLAGATLGAIGYEGSCLRAEQAVSSVVHIPTGDSLVCSELPHIATLLREFSGNDKTYGNRSFSD